MIFADINLTSEVIVFIGGIVVAIISVLIYLGAIDKRVSVLETRTITRDEFFKLKEDMIRTVREEIKNIEGN
jgi:hypothetical protein